MRMGMEKVKLGPSQEPRYAPFFGFLAASWRASGQTRVLQEPFRDQTSVFSFSFSRVRSVELQLSFFLEFWRNNSPFLFLIP
jgi:hypothetical protein